MAMTFDIPGLLLHALSGGGKQNSENGACDISDRCLKLFEKDYQCEVLENNDGQLCSTYPAKIFIPYSSKGNSKVGKLRDSVLKARFARTRGRFVVPVLLINGKYVCRSSTLARSPEMYCRQGYGYWVQGDTVQGSSIGDDALGEEASFLNESERFNSNGISVQKDMDQDEGKEWLLDKMRNSDISLLQFLKVDTIFDLMVENKKVKFGMNVTSSEKADRKQRYLKFNLVSIPYPGCEFFAEYRKNGYEAEALIYDWKQNFVDARLHLPGTVTDLCNVSWDEYTNWDLAILTKNYLLLHLRVLMHDSSTGVLLHCISGWDRTPLFVSLMRLSLWADGLVHKSLNAREMAYFTVAYDWLLFQHRFNERFSNGEEIFYFCFDFLKYICGDEFSLQQQYSTEDKCGCSPVHEESDVNLHQKIYETTEFINEVPLRLISHEQTGSFEHLCCTRDSNDGVRYENGKINPVDTFPSAVEESYSHANSVDDTCNGSNGTQSAILPIQQTLENTSISEHVSQEASTREAKLMEVRQLVIDAYNEAANSLNEREPTNTGLAATLFNHITRTFNLAK